MLLSPLGSHPLHSLEIVGVTVWYDGVFLLQNEPCFHAVFSILDRAKRINSWNTSTMKTEQIWKYINRFNFFYNLDGMRGAKPGQILQLYKVSHFQKIEGMHKKRWNQHRLTLPLYISSRLTCVAFLTFQPGVPLSESKPTPYTKKTPYVGGRRVRECGGSLQAELNITHCL